MSSPFERAHLRMLESHELPVRTHERRETIYPKQGQGRRIWTPDQKQRLMETIKARIEAGGCNVDIADELGVSASTVQRHRRRLQGKPSR